MEPVIEYKSTNLDPEQSLFVCSNCRLLNNDSREEAALCCICRRCEKVPSRFGNLCDDCRKEANKEVIDARKAKEVALPVKAQYEYGPVYWEHEFFEDLQALVDNLDENVDISAIVVYECNVDKAIVPDLVDYVTESWSEQFEDGGDHLTKADAQALRAVERSIAVPDVWTPDRSQRLSVDALMSVRRA